jgi:hypothetical protein
VLYMSKYRYESVEGPNSALSICPEEASAIYIVHYLGWLAQRACWRALRYDSQKFLSSPNCNFAPRLNSSSPLKTFGLPRLPILYSNPTYTKIADTPSHRLYVSSPSTHAQPRLSPPFTSRARFPPTGCAAHLPRSLPYQSDIRTRCPTT